METYAAEIIDGLVTQVIVGDASWAIERLGGQWVDSDTLVGIGWTWTSAGGFSQPVEPPSE